MGVDVQSNREKEVTLPNAIYTDQLRGTPVLVGDKVGAMFVVNVGTITDGTHRLLIEHSDDGITWNGVTASSGDITEDPPDMVSNTTQKIGYCGGQAYVRGRTFVTGASSGGQYEVSVEYVKRLSGFYDLSTISVVQGPRSLVPVPSPPAGSELTYPRNYVIEVLAGKPLGYWQMNDAGPDDAVDSSENGKDGTYEDTTHSFQETGAPPFDVGDFYHNVATGAGVPRIEVPADADLDVIGAPDQEYTFEVWFNTTDAAVQLVIKTDGGAINELALAAGAPKFTVNASSVTDAGTLNDGAWHHLVGIRALGSGAHTIDALLLYVDGVLLDSLAFAAGDDASGATALKIGGDVTASERDDAHCAVYTRALSDAEVEAHFLVGTTAPL